MTAYVSASAAPAAIAACPVAAPPTPSSAHAGAAPRCTTCVSAPPTACSRANRSTPSGSGAARAQRHPPPARPSQARGTAQPRHRARPPRARRRAPRSGTAAAPQHDDPVLQRVAQAPRNRALEPQSELGEQRRRGPARRRDEHERGLQQRHATRREQRADQRHRQQRQDQHAANGSEPPHERPRDIAPLITCQRSEHAREHAGPADARGRRDPGRHGKPDREAPVVRGTQRARHEQHEPGERQRFERLGARAAGQRPPRKGDRRGERVLPAVRAHAGEDTAGTRSTRSPMSLRRRQGLKEQRTPPELEEFG